MPHYRYTFQGFNKETMVRAVGRFLPISYKTSVEITRFIKNKQIDQALTLLNAVAEGEQAIPFKRFKKDIPHRRGKGISVGRFPKKASQHIAKLLKALKSNAEDRGFNITNLRVVHAVAQRGPLLWHYGRHRGRRRKVAHIEVIAQEVKESKKQKLPSKDRK